MSRALPALLLALFVVFSAQVAVTSPPDAERAGQGRRERRGEVPAPRLLIVTNTDDDGAGSLRQVLLDANAECNASPCSVKFAIQEPLPATGWFTIRPGVALPEVTANYLVIDGASQTESSGDTNAPGPEIEISGENLTGETPVLALHHGCQTALRNVVLDHGPGPGLSLLNDAPAYDPTTCPYAVLNTTSFEYNDPADISHNYFGVDPTGRVAAPNGRGIAGYFSSEFNIHDNIVSGNRFSGIYLNAPRKTGVSKNRIGTTRDGEPLGNGGSGIYAAPLFDLYSQNLSMSGNVIAYNRQWGIALASNTNVAYVSNQIFGNELTAIATPLGLSVSGDVFLHEPTYDPGTNRTTIRGHLPQAFPTYYSLQVSFFSSFGLGRTGLGEAEIPLGLTGVVSGHAGFEFVVPGDLRGRYITAIVTYTVVRSGGFTADSYTQSSGLSAPVLVP